MPKSWFNDGFEYIFSCVDVFSKKADMILLKDREQKIATKAFEKILNNLGIPKRYIQIRDLNLKMNLFKSYWINIILKKYLQ
jgi:hypothetical protein